LKPYLFAITFLIAITEVQAFPEWLKNQGISGFLKILFYDAGRDRQKGEQAKTIDQRHLITRVSGRLDGQPFDHKEKERESK
jgi:hypothetical protein